MHNKFSESDYQVKKVVLTRLLVQLRPFRSQGIKNLMECWIKRLKKQCDYIQN